MAKVVEIRENGTRRVMYVPEGESLTEQAHAQASDINQIMLRYEKSGLLPQRTEAPRFGDFTGIFDYHTAVEAVKRAQDAFMSLDPRVRARFENDPGKLLAFLDQIGADPALRKEAQELGLVNVPDTAPNVGDVVPAESESGK